jgi:hypothetical protein
VLEPRLPAHLEHDHLCRALHRRVLRRRPNQMQVHLVLLSVL